ncbi:MAG: sigma-70 family RNA polymerase sigma factor [Bacteriovoracaceae bacterium]|nr:sigma-70 family RNA polymerase sigma factor [Bacteriovoracaceae bacterium]
MQLSNDRYEEFYRRLGAYLAPKVPAQSDVEDLTQEILLKVSVGLDSLSESKKIIPWMYSIAHNTLVDFYRRNKIRSTYIVDTAEISDLEAQNTPESNFNPEFAKCIRSLLKELPDKYAHALECTELGGLSQKEFAEHNNLSHSGAKSQVQRARKLLRKSIQKCCRPISDKYGNIVDAKVSKKCCK